MLRFLPSFAREERLEEGELIGNYIIRTRYERIGEALRLLARVSSAGRHIGPVESREEAT